MERAEFESFTEVESKFSVSADTTLPSLTGIDGLAQVLGKAVHNLSAVYFDTADLRLSRSKITLRRRTGGHDDGWHIKLPADMGRQELRLPLGSGEVPEEFRALLRAYVRDLPLLPIAQIDNERTEFLYGHASTGPLLELCDDHVTARSLIGKKESTSWREWEVELTDPEHSRAEALMTATANTLKVAGATASLSPSKLATALGSAVETSPVAPMHQEPNVPARSAHAVALHHLRELRDELLACDLKVRRRLEGSLSAWAWAVSHLKEALGTLHFIVDEEAVSPLEHDLGRLDALASQAQRLERVGTTWCEHPAPAALADIKAKDLARAFTHVDHVVNSPQYLELLNNLDDFLASPILAGSIPVKPAKKSKKSKAQSPTKAARKQLEKPLRIRLAAVYVEFMGHHKAGLVDSIDAGGPAAAAAIVAAKQLASTAALAQEISTLKGKKLARATAHMVEVVHSYEAAIHSRAKVARLAQAADKAGQDSFDLGVMFHSEHQRCKNLRKDYQRSVKDLKHEFKALTT